MSDTTTAAPMPVVERELEPKEQATYDRRTATYVMSRRYHVWLPVEQALAMSFASAAAFPGTGLPDPPIPPQYDLLSPDWGVPLTLWPVTRHAEYLGHDQSALWQDGQQHEHCNLTVTYEGHVCMYPPSNDTGASTTTSGPGAFNGVVASRFEQGTKSEQILVSYDLDSQGRRLAIGPNNEGTNRLVPACRWLITQNVVNGDYGVLEEIIQSLIGIVNEPNWTDPVYGYSWWEGVWLYLGPQTVQNRDGTYTLVHQFDYDLHNAEQEALCPTTTAGRATWYSHKFPWYDLNEQRVAVGNGVMKIRKVPVPPLHLSALYLTAREDTGAGYLFADLFRSTNYPFLG